MFKHPILLQVLVGCAVFTTGALIQPATLLATLAGVASAFSLIAATGLLTMRLSHRPEMQFLVLILEFAKLAIAAALLITAFSQLSAAGAQAFGIAFGALYLLSYLTMMLSMPHLVARAAGER